MAIAPGLFCEGFAPAREGDLAVAQTDLFTWVLAEVLAVSPDGYAELLCGLDRDYVGRRTRIHVLAQEEFAGLTAERIVDAGGGRKFPTVAHARTWLRAAVFEGEIREDLHSDDLFRRSLAVARMGETISGGAAG